MALVLVGLHVTRRRRRFVVADVLEVAVAERSGTATPPATDPAGFEDGAGVQKAHAQGCDRPADIDVPRRRRCLVVTDDLGVAIAELSCVARAPATHRAAREQRAGAPGAARLLSHNSANVD